MTRKCPNCSAILKRLDERFCGFCGTEVPIPAAPSTAPPSRHGDVPARFAALERHPRLAELMRRVPSDGWVTGGLVFRIFFGIFFGGVGLVVGLGFVASIFGAPFALLPFAFTAIGLWIVIDAIRKQGRYGSSPLLREAALVVGERTRVSGGGQNSSASTSYYVTIETSDGDRREYTTRGSVVGEVSEGDMGIAYVRGGYLLDFARLPV